jgi:hypothetical protein
MNEISIDKLSNTNIKTVEVTRHANTSPTPNAKPIIQLDKASVKQIVPIDDLNLLSDLTKVKSETFVQMPHTPPTPLTPKKSIFSSEIADISDILGQQPTSPSITVKVGDKPTTTSPSPSPSDKKEETSFFSSIFKSAAPVPAKETPSPPTVRPPAPVAPAFTARNAPANVTNVVAGKQQPTPPKSTPVTTTLAPIELTESEKQKEKQELLFRLGRMKERGFPISKTYTMSSSYEEIKQEFYKIKAQKDMQNSVKFQRKMMMAIVTGVEFLNTKFDPFDIKLEGWSESVHENSDEYDDIFEELHEKYKEKAKMAPEMRLFLSITGSAFMFHLTQSLFKTVPNVEEVLKQNPDLMKQFAQATVNSGMGFNAPPPPPPPPQQHQPAGGMPMGGGMGGMGGGGGMGGLLSNLMGGGGGMMGGMMGGGMNATTSKSDDLQSDTNSVQSLPRNEMTGPVGMDDILNELSNSVSTRDISRLSDVQSASIQDIADHGNSMAKMKSSGYRRRTTDGVRLNI